MIQAMFKSPSFPIGIIPWDNNLLLLVRETDDIVNVNSIPGLLLNFHGKIRRRIIKKLTGVAL